jgi:hypothetical protein
VVWVVVGVGCVGWQVARGGVERLGHGLAFERFVAVGPDRCGLAVCVALVSFPRFLGRGFCLVPEFGYLSPSPGKASAWDI